MAASVIEDRAGNILDDAMWSFNIRPFVGAIPITFGMSRAEVHAILGAPQVESLPSQESGISDMWNDGNVQVGYDNEAAVDHVGFGPGDFSLLLDGSPLWSASAQPDPNPFLLRLDPAPKEVAGILVFDRIGVTTSGYHDDDENQESITAYPLGVYDSLLQKDSAIPDLSRYQPGA